MKNNSKVELSVIIPLTHIPVLNYYYFVNRNINIISKLLNCEFIIVDNSNFQKEALNYIKNWERQGHKVLKYPFKFSYPKVFNYAAKYATAEYILFMEPLTIVNKITIPKLLKIMKDENYDVLFPTYIFFNFINNEYFISFINFFYNLLKPLKLLYYKVKKSSKPSPYSNLFIKIFIFLLNPLVLILKKTYGYIIEDNKVKEIKTFLTIGKDINAYINQFGMCLVKREVFNKINGFDENYINFFYDMDFCIKAKNENYKIATTKEVSVVSVKSFNLGHFINNKFPYLYDKENFNNKWFTKLKKEKKILVVKMLTMGDAIMCSPTIKALKEKFSDYQVVVVSMKPWSEIFEDNPYIDRLITISLNFKPKLSNYKIYDIVTSALLNISKWEYVYQLNCLDHYPEYRRTGLHFRDFYASMADVYPLKDKKYQVFVKDTTFEKVYKILKELNLHDKNFVVLHTNGGWYLKNWDKNKWRSLVKVLYERYGFLSVIVGGKGEYLEGENVSNLAGKLSIKETAALIKMSKLFIGLDSGPTHLASAMNVPVVALFGNTHPKVSEPNCDSYICIHSASSCEVPCGLKFCYKNINCTSEIKVESVLKAVDKLLTTKNIQEIWLEDKPAKVFFKDWEWHIAEG